MSISVYRLKQVDDIDLSRSAALVLIEHWPKTSDENTDYVQVNADDLEEILESAAECDGSCVTQMNGNETRVKKEHDDAIVELGEKLPKFLELSARDGQEGWVTIQINW